MEKLAFDDLQKTKTAIVDLGSAWRFLQQPVLEFIQGDHEEFRQTCAAWRQRDHAQRLRLWPLIAEQLRTQPYREGLRLLEQLVVNKNLAVDEALLNENLRFPIARKKVFALAKTPCLYACEIPREVRETAAREIAQRGATIRKAVHDPQFFDGSDKMAHDGLYSLDDIYRGHCFADSDDSVERTLFYLTVARCAKAPLVVSEAKQALLEEFRDRLRRHFLTNVHDQLSKSSAVSDALGEIDCGSLPPIAEQIVIACLQNDVSPWDATMSIRQSEPAIAYRKMIHGVTDALCLGYGDQQHALDALKKLEELLATWARDPEEGISYRTRKLTISKFPGLGFLADMVDVPASIKDPSLTTPDPTHVFMSRWMHPFEASME